MSKSSDYYFIPSGINSDVCNVIVDSFKNKPLEDSSIIGSSSIDDYEQPGEVNSKIRSSKQLWIATDHWVSGMMAHFVHCANYDMFNYDIVQWADQIQYTVYEGKNSHYSWHKDSNRSTFSYDGTPLIRKLSISLCLSSKDDYDGGEFQIMYGHKDMKTIKLDVGDVIVFSSDCVHRVRPLKSGKRISLVGWFAGPKFR